MKFRIWLDDTKQMATCSDYMIDSAGNVYELSLDSVLPPHIVERPDAIVMLASQYIWRRRNPPLSNSVLYEYDIVSHNGDLGLVCRHNDCFQVYFPLSHMDKDEHLWRFLYGTKDLHFIGNYFQHNYSDEILDFLEKLPDEAKYLLTKE